MMRSHGYATGLIWKWQLGKRDEHHPLCRGFDECYGMLAGGSLYIDSRIEGVESWPARNAPAVRAKTNAIYDGRARVQAERYITDVLRDRAVDFIERHRQERFFLMLTPNAPHTPLRATKEYLDRYRHIEDASERRMDRCEATRGIASKEESASPSSCIGLPVCHEGSSIASRPSC